jgi:L,D-transpeptidase-like protein/translation initiation factor IF-2-like protein
MSRKRVYEIARERGVPSRQLMERLREAGIDVATPASVVEEWVALDALDGDGSAAAEARRGPKAPEFVIRDYLDAHGGSVEVPIHNLLTTWQRQTLDKDALELISGGLRRADVGVSPALRPGMDPETEVRLRSGGPQRARERRSTAAGRRPAKPPARERAPTPKPAPESAPAAPQVGIVQRLTLRWELQRLRRRHDQQLRAFGGVVFELYRAGAQRPELVSERLDRLYASSAELARIEEKLGDRSDEGVCPACGLYSGDARFCLACGEAVTGRGSEVIQRMSTPMVVLAVVLLVGGLLFGGIRFNQDDPAPAVQSTAQPPAGPGFRHLVAHVRGRRIGVYRQRGLARPFRKLRSPNPDGAPLAFLIKALRPDWAQVYLPIRPNGSVGWIRLADVSVEGHNYRVRIDLTRHRLVAWKGDRRIMRTKVGVGKAVTPTPTGVYYITELLKQPDSSGLYGPWAFGLSAHSNVLHEFAGADGILGLHGTNEPWLVGTDVSHGCLRLKNRVITKLARTLPVGTPVRITRS